MQVNYINLSRSVLARAPKKRGVPSLDIKSPSPELILISGDLASAYCVEARLAPPWQPLKAGQCKANVKLFLRAGCAMWAHGPIASLIRLRLNGIENNFPNITSGGADD
jgi:hypothetical protein